MNGKKWIGIFFIFTIMSVGFVGGVNYVVDPNGLNNKFRINHINTAKESNTAYTTRFKANILGKGGFDTLLLGTSRIGVMNPDVVNNYLGCDSFNLEYPGSVAKIQKELFLYANNFNKIKNLVYGIDFMAFNKSRSIENDFKEFYELETKIQNNQLLSSYDFYFNAETLLKSSKVVLKNLVNKKNLQPGYSDKNGMREYKNFIKDLNDNRFQLDKEIKNSIKGYFRPSTGIYKNYEFSNEYLEDFKETLLYCKENDIKVWVYIPPMYSEHYDAINSAGYFDEFELFKKELSKITEFMDFTGHNEITKNKNNYWDSSHLRKEMTETIMAKIFNDKTMNVPKDFGVLVTKQNIEEHLQNLREQIEFYDLNKSLKSVK